VIIAQAKTCPHCGSAVQAHAQHLHAVYDTIELPPIKPVVTRVEQQAEVPPPAQQTWAIAHGEPAAKESADTMLMAKARYLDALDLPATSVGDEIAKRHFDEGIESSQKLWGLPVVTHVKSDIYPTDKGWIFSPTTPNNFLGNFFTLQDATLFIKQEADIISFWTYEYLGIGIANTLSMQEIVFS
jgi:hypothetical protein